MRPPVIETDDGDYIKLPSTVGPPYTTVSGKTSGRRNRDMRLRKRDTSEKHSGQLSIKSNGNIPKGKSENPVQKESQKASEAHVLKSLFDEESVSLKKVSMTSNGEVSGGPKSNPGAYIMVSILFFTMFLGKLLGILCTLILVCSLYPHRKNDGNDVRISENMVVNWPDKGSPEEYKKRVIMAGLLERKSHYR
ncbi:hypothetical protein L1987_16914 [Smallanthus sonchifolius]|uniref:Uncharacterized protein n=1 Tax=Smallanthus sonchifolius TaxID=185202 RepID=A0ACB9IWJ7_9ASTR|nr:hypothetical protein L1987_16914 [Smallanthus sonchifolius]